MCTKRLPATSHIESKLIKYPLIRIHNAFCNKASKRIPYLLTHKNIPSFFKKKLHYSKQFSVFFSFENFPTKNLYIYKAKQTLNLISIRVYALLKKRDIKVISPLHNTKSWICGSTHFQIDFISSMKLGNWKTENKKKKKERKTKSFINAYR